MPVIEVNALPQKDPSKIKPALMKTAVALAKTTGCKPQQVWATWNEIQPGHYVEGENEVKIQPNGTHPPLVKLTCFEGKNAEKIEEILQLVATTLSESLGIPGNIFIIYHEAQSGRVIAGNDIIRRKD